MLTTEADVVHVHQWAPWYTNGVVRLLVVGTDSLCTFVTGQCVSGSLF